jgi:hypothetical protein
VANDIQLLSFCPSKLECFFQNASLIIEGYDTTIPIECALKGTPHLEAYPAPKYLAGPKILPEKIYRRKAQTYKLTSTMFAI